MGQPAFATDYASRVTYDREANVIYFDLSYLAGTAEMVAAFMRVGVECAKGCRTKPFVLSCWQDVAMTPAGADTYKALALQILPLVEGVLRYQISEPLSRVFVRSMTLTSPGKAPQMFPNKEEALAYVKAYRALKVVTPNA